MFAVVFDIFVVIEDIDTAGDATEADEAVGDVDDLMKVQEFSREEKGDEQEEILCPVFGPQEFEICHNNRLSAKIQTKGRNL